MRVDLPQQLLRLLHSLHHHLGLAAFGRIVDMQHLAEQAVTDGIAVRVLTHEFKHHIQITPLRLARIGGRLHHAYADRLLCPRPGDVPDISH